LLNISEKAYLQLESIVIDENKFAGNGEPWTVETFAEHLIEKYYLEAPMFTEGSGKK
jgi:hypothetical protein